MTENDATNENVAEQLRDRLPKLPQGQFWRIRKVEVPLADARSQSARVVGKLLNNVVNKNGGDLRVELREHVNTSNDLTRNLVSNLGYTRLLAEAAIYTKKNSDSDIVADILNEARRLLREQGEAQVEKDRKNTFTGDFS